MRRFLQRVRRFKRSIGPLNFFALTRTVVARGYAAILMLILCYAGFRASKYLYSLVATPAQTPAQFVHPRDSQGQFANVAPLAGSSHDRTTEYHLPAGRTISDVYNSCTIAGCHNVLPHSSKMKLPAFANMHGAFLDCLTCHAQVAKPMNAIWVSRQTGQVVEVPAVLTLDKLLHDRKDTIREHPELVHRELLSLGQQILKIRDTDRGLQAILFQIETAQPGSPVWRGGVTRLSEEFSRHATFDYGAKLIPTSRAADYLQQYRATEKLARSYLFTSSGNEPRRNQNDPIHRGLLAQATGCAACHADAPGQLNFEAAGYLPGRAKALGDLQLARVLEKVRLGGTFRLPTLVEETHANTK